MLIESKPRVREMYESEYRQKWKKSKNFRLLEVSAFQCGKLDKLNAIRIFFSQCKVADCDFHEGNQNLSYRGTTLRQESWSMFVNNLPEFLDNQDFDAKIIINWLSIVFSAKGLGSFFWNFGRLTQTCSCWESSVRITTYVNTWSAFFNKLDHGDCDARHRTTEFSRKNFFTVKILLFDT